MAESKWKKIAREFRENGMPTNKDLGLNMYIDRPNVSKESWFDDIPDNAVSTTKFR